MTADIDTKMTADNVAKMTADIDAKMTADNVAKMSADIDVKNDSRHWRQNDSRH